ncbi:MAG: glutamine synthetase family protein [Halieaceae bacterium]|nr:glutamine synthetase family protein [Halieaceae bacterium]
MTSEVDRFLREYPQVSMIEALLPDANGILRGKWLPRDKLHTVYDGELKFPKTALALDIFGRDVEERVFASGDEDGICLPIKGSLLPAPWSPQGSHGQLMLTMFSADGTPYLGDARQVLKQVVARYNARGWRPVVAAELEFSLLRWDGDRPAHSQANLYRGEAIGGNLYCLDLLKENRRMLEQIHHACLVQKLPFDGVVKESAPSQYEINMRHVDSPVLAARQVLMMKRVIKEVARQHELVASFMPKPFEGEAGNGLHVHCSVLDERGDNIFDNGSDEGSEALRSAIAGCLAYMPDSFAVFAPSFNAYRRFRKGSHAPVTPNWGYENRTVAVRVPAGSPRARRLEHRVAGADANPYLAMAVILAAAMEGIERGLQPGEPVSGDGYSSEEATLPLYMHEALERFRNSRFIADNLGTELQGNFSLTKEQELNEFERHISGFEYHAYLERL